GENGLIFIGPSPASMETMGNKLAAKEAALRFNIPMVPGGNKAIQNVHEGFEISKKVGYPVLIKASAGGGGKGMRIVESEESFVEEMARAVSEATNAFGDGSVFIEKYIGSPRHIEIQILGDVHGTVLHLFERECSVQRRYQKVVEEAPSSILTPELREAMGKSAVDVGKACGYFGAGTVEFILDENLNYYFLEMNTRLQVEHPVTEMITGLDLVKEQIRIAEGKPLSFRQEDLKINGHAIELRVYAEDPNNYFLPDTGKLIKYKIPQGPGVRVDGGFEQGMEIPIYYDPMIAKLVVHAGTRVEAIERMKRAIDEFQVSGVENTLSFGKFVMNHEAFVSGKFDTHFVKKYFTKAVNDQQDHTSEEEIAALMVLSLLQKKPGAIDSSSRAREESKWKNRRK
ncbi:MAG TPA: biotin carboxylase, partial [Cytophagaceae bacterium]